MAKILDGFSDIKTLTYAHSSAVSKGDELFINGRLCVASCNADAGEPIGWIYWGRVEVNKAAALAIDAGEKVYWNTTNKNITKTDTDGFSGMCKEAAGADDTTVVVMLGQV